MNRIIVTIAAAAVLASPYFSQRRKNSPGPDFTLKNYDGSEVKMADFKSKIVVLEWFSYECPFCRYHYEKSSTMNDLAANTKTKTSSGSR